MHGNAQQLSSERIHRYAPTLAAPWSQARLQQCARLHAQYFRVCSSSLLFPPSLSSSPRVSPPRNNTTRTHDAFTRSRHKNRTHTRTHAHNNSNHDHNHSHHYHTNFRPTRASASTATSWCRCPTWPTATSRTLVVGSWLWSWLWSWLLPASQRRLNEIMFLGSLRDNPNKIISAGHEQLLTVQG